MKRIGLIGCGAVATYGHLPAIRRTAGLALAAVCDIDPARVAAAQQGEGPRPEGFTDPNAMLAADLDAVVITSPAPLHRDHVMLAAKHRKPVLCEKPLAMSEPEAEHMIAEMATARVPLYVGFTYRFSPAALKIYQLVQSRAIGQLRSLRLVYNWDVHGKFSPRDVAGAINERRRGRMLEGGPMVDCGTHQIDLSRWWTQSEIGRARGVGAWIEDYEAPDHLYLHADHENGAHTLVEICYSFGHTGKEGRSAFVYELIGTEGLIRYDRGTKLFECVTCQGTQTLPWSEEKNFDGMYAEFARALETGQRGSMPTGEDGLIATRLARMATEDAMATRQV